jgi:hypothetical protein
MANSISSGVLMKKLFLLASLFITSAYACQQDEIKFPQNNVCAKLNWITGPFFDQFNSASISLSETNFKLNVLPWMVMTNGHDHGSRPVVLTTIAPREYLVEKIYFMKGMQGNWFLRLQLINEKKEIIEEVRTLVEL